MNDRLHGYGACSRDILPPGVTVVSGICIFRTEWKVVQRV